VSEEAARALVYRYGDLLDSRDFEAWLALFDENYGYRVVLRANYERNELLSLIKDDRHCLKHRTEAYRCGSEEIWRPESSLHLFSNVVSNADDGDSRQVRAAALLLLDGRLAFAGRYFMGIGRRGDGWAIRNWLILLEEPAHLSPKCLASARA
jgi:3-phenylpropionate/cinnamic acid dioxygenase small subunit